MLFWALKNFSIVLSPVEQISRELEKIRIELDPQLEGEYAKNVQVRQSLEQLTSTPEFELLTQDLYYDYPQFKASKLNFNLINAMQHAQEGYVPTLRLIANAPWHKYYLTANGLRDVPSYHLNSQLMLDAPMFINLDHSENPLFKNPIKSYILSEGIGGYVKMGFRNNLMAEDPAERFVEFSTPRFYSSTYKQEYESVIHDSYGICMWTLRTHLIKILFSVENNQLKLTGVYDRHRAYDRRYFFKGFKMINDVFDYLDWAIKLALQTPKNPLVQTRIKQGMISNRELITIER